MKEDLRWATETFCHKIFECFDGMAKDAKFEIFINSQFVGLGFFLMWKINKELLQEKYCWQESAAKDNLGKIMLHFTCNWRLMWSLALPFISSAPQYSPWLWLQLNSPSRGCFLFPSPSLLMFPMGHSSFTGSVPVRWTTDVQSEGELP